MTYNTLFVLKIHFLQLPLLYFIFFKVLAHIPSAIQFAVETSIF